MRQILRATAFCSAIAGATFLSGAFAARSASPACNVTGVWELTGETANGKPVDMKGYRQRKIVTKGHFMWIGQPARRDTLPLRTELDSMRYYQMSGGAGTWTLTGRDYVEHIEYFVDPAWVGRDWKATCDTDGDRWRHSYRTPSTRDTSSSAPHDAVTEEWRRIE